MKLQEEMREIKIGYFTLSQGGIGVFVDLENWEDRHLKARATNYDNLIYTRNATIEEAEYYRPLYRVKWYKAETIDQLLESEIPILGEQSAVYKRLKKEIQKANIKPYKKRELKLFGGKAKPDSKDNARSFKKN